MSEPKKDPRHERPRKPYERPAVISDEVFETLALANIDVVVGDGTEGYPPRAPYDAIIVTAGGPRVPDALREQLAVDGRLVVPVGSSVHQELVIVRRRADGYEERRGEACVFVPLIGAQGWRDSLRRTSGQ